MPKLANQKALEAMQGEPKVSNFTIPSEEIKIMSFLKKIDLGKLTIYFQPSISILPPYITSILEVAKNQINKVYLNIDIIASLGQNGQLGIQPQSKS